MLCVCVCVCVLLHVCVFVCGKVCCGWDHGHVVLHEEFDQTGLDKVYFTWLTYSLFRIVKQE